MTDAGIRTWVLALDNDDQSRQTTKALRKAMNEAGLICTITIPERDGEDWNDALLRGADPLSIVTELHDEESGEVVPEQPGGNDEVSTTDRDSESSAIVLVHDVDAPPDTLDSLSHADQAITADYYDHVLTTYPRAVIAAPCGMGKTYAAAEYMARRQQEGVLYVAERTEQIKDMQKLLTTQYEVPAEMIGTYYTNSADLKALHTAETSRPIALITQARMQLYAPQAYVMFHRHGSLQYRRLMIVDESLPALIILSVSTVFVEGLLHRMGLTWDDTGKLDPDEMDRRIHQIDETIAAHAVQPLRHVGIQYLEWTNYLKENDTSIGIRRHAYYLMLYQILSGSYLRHDKAIDVLIPMAPHMTWCKLFEHILTLDATAHITDYLYTDYAILTPGRWNYEDIVETYTVYSSIGNLTKTAIAKHRETYLQELHDHVAPMLADRAFEDPYVVTYKTLNGEPFVEDVRTMLGVAQVQNYGGTRGSNAYRTTSSAVLLGAYRPPVPFDQLAALLFGPCYSPSKYAVAHWVQEIYRTRIRNRTGETIKLFVAGEETVVKALKAYTQLFLHPLVISGPARPDWVEQTLKQRRLKAQQALYRELVATRKVSIKSFANHHTGRNVSKVERALRGLLQTAPALTEHIKWDQEYIYLVDKPAPTR